MQIARQICAKFCNFDHVSEEFWDETKGLLVSLWVLKMDIELHRKICVIAMQDSICRKN
jgi:hypothetical protein